MASYYKTIKGIKYDRALLELAEAVTSGRGDGRISLKDARAILNKVKDGGEYSDVEKKTVQYIRDNFKFTDSADKWFREEIRKWAATKKKTVKKAPVKKKTAKKAAKKTVTKKKTAKKAVKKKTPAKKKAARKKPAPKKSAPTAAPEPKETYISTVPEPSPILQQEPAAEKEGTPWFKILIALIIIVAAVYLINTLWKDSPGGKPEKVAKIEKKEPTDASKDIKKPEPVEKKELTPVEMTFERIPPVVKSIESIKVYFGKGSGWINHAERKKLLKIAEYLKANPDKKLYIVGHACSLGSPRLNNDLSLYRARNAAKYLKLKGVPESQLTPTSIGEKQPVRANPTEENLWQNRLIEFDIR